MLPRIHTRLKSLFSGIVERNENKTHFFDNSNRVARIFYRLSAYRRLSWHMLRNGVSVGDIVRSQFPLIDPDPQAPVELSLEFTNHCNLRCVYCTSPLGLRKKGFMEKDTLKKVAEGIDELGVKRVRIVGNGESTLHPEFGWMLRELCAVTPFVSVLTNGQWRRSQETIKAMLDAPVSMVEFSVDAVTKGGYERSRVGGRFERLLGNLDRLNAARASSASRIMTNIRVMMRPSERPHEKEIMAFWKDYADTVMPQYVVGRQFLPYDDDIYEAVQADEQSYPNCASPFKSFGVQWDGDVPLCSLSAQQIGAPGLILGNVATSTLSELWQGATIEQYREGHRTRDCSKMEICQGCTGL